MITIIDTDVQLNHPDLDGKIVAGYDFVSNDTSANNGNGYGTHVAGSAAAETNNNRDGAGLCQTKIAKLCHYALSAAMEAVP